MTTNTGRVRAALAALALCALLSAQNSITVNGIANQRSTAGGVTTATGTTDTGGAVTLLTATGLELYAVSVGGYVTAVTGTGGSGSLIVTCGATQAANISAPTGDAVEQFTTSGGGVIPPVTSCYVKSGDTITYEFDATANAMSTISQTYRISLQKVQ